MPFLAEMKKKGLKIYEVDGNGDEKTVNQRILSLVTKNGQSEDFGAS